MARFGVVRVLLDRLQTAGLVGSRPAHIKLRLVGRKFVIDVNWYSKDNGVLCYLGNRMHGWNYIEKNNMNMKTIALYKHGRSVIRIDTCGDGNHYDLYKIRAVHDDVYVKMRTYGDGKIHTYYHKFDLKVKAYLSNRSNQTDTNVNVYKNNKCMTCINTNHTVPDKGMYFEHWYWFWNFMKTRIVGYY